MLIHTTSPSPHTEEDFNENSYVLMSSSLHSEADAPEHHDLSILRARYREESEEALEEEAPRCQQAVASRQIQKHILQANAPHKL
jgi:hypothetical protein